MGSKKRKAAEAAAAEAEQNEQQQEQYEQEPEAAPKREIAEEDEFDLTKLKKAKSSTDAALPEVARPTRVFVGNVPFSATEDSVREMFGKFGEIIGVHFILDKATQKWYGSIMIDYEDHFCAAKAIKLNGTQMENRPIKVNWAQGRQANAADRFASKKRGGLNVAEVPVSEKPEGTDTVFLGKVPHDAEESEIRAIFEKCGTINDIRWVEKDGQFKGCGFIEYDSTEATDEAVKLNGTMVRNRAIRVDYAQGSKRVRDSQQQE